MAEPIGDQKGNLQEEFRAMASSEVSNLFVQNTFKTKTEPGGRGRTLAAPVYHETNRLAHRCLPAIVRRFISASLVHK